MNDFNYIDYSEMMRDARRGLEREREELEEKVSCSTPVGAVPRGAALKKFQI
jgi:hypothetical protein